MDGFRALAHPGPNETRLVSRRGNVYKQFTELDCEAVRDERWCAWMGTAGRSSTIC